MLLDKYRKSAKPKTKSQCPCCDEVVIAKCGKLKIWHWAHEKGSECDHWWEPESEWHYGWKLKVPEDFREIIMDGHRADIKLPSGLVIELQNSSITSEEILEREDFYDNMIWIFNGEKFLKNFIMFKSDKEWGDESYRSFHWKRPRHYIPTCEKEVYLDFGEYIFHVKKFYAKEYERSTNWGDYTTIRYNGWGFLLPREQAINRILNQYSVDKWNPNSSLTILSK